jgi:hypothetical protein
VWCHRLCVGVNLRKGSPSLFPFSVSQCCGWGFLLQKYTDFCSGMPK